MTSTTSHWFPSIAKSTNPDSRSQSLALPWQTLPMVSVYRTVTLAILLSLLWKSSYYPMVWQAYRQLELVDGFFPTPFRSATVLAGLILLAMASIVIGWLPFARRALPLLAGLLTACMAGMCWHQGTYNDVTFLTGFWAAAWCTWLACSLHQPREQVLARGQRLAVLIVSLMFLGGALGKWTPGYWSGEVLYQIYFVDRDFWFFNLLRGWLDTESLRAFATGYSRMVVVVESLGAGLWLLPVRWAGAIGMLTLLGIIVFSNFYLFSVMFSLLGLCLVAMLPTPAGGTPER